MKLSAAYVKIGDSKNADNYTLKYWIANGKAITTGSSNGDWSEIVRTGIYSEKKAFAGHCWQINGYDDNYVFPDGSKGGFHCPNSWGGVGAFWIKYSDIGVLYTQYYEVGVEDIDALKKIQEAKEVNANKFYEAAKAKGIINGERPNDIASETEISIMAYRTQGIKDRKLTRQAWADIIQSNILR